jgi:hypothetical protein
MLPIVLIIIQIAAGPEKFNSNLATQTRAKHTETNNLFFPSSKALSSLSYQLVFYLGSVKGFS